MGTLITNSGDTTVASGTVVSTETTSSPPTQPDRLDPFFSVPSLIVSAPKIDREIEEGVSVSITF